MDPYSAALGLAPPRSAPNPAAGSGIVRPWEETPDSNEPAALNAALSKTGGTQAERQGRADLARYAANPGASAARPAANDPYSAALGIGVSQPQSQAAQATPAQSQPPEERNAFLRGIDANPTLAQGIHQATGLGASIYGGLKGAAIAATGGGANAAANAVTQAREDYTYKPAPGSAGAPGVEAAGSIYNPLTWIGRLGDVAGEKTADVAGPAAGALVNTAVNAAPLLFGVKGTPKGAKPAAAAERVEPTMTPAQPAAPAAPTLAQASPELQSAVKSAQDRGVKVNPEVLDRHVIADTLPVPVKLTEGQALIDPVKISEEMNGRGKGQAAPVPPEFYQQQGKALAQNMDVIRSTAAPDIPATSSIVDHGQALIDAYKQMDAPVKADISAKYKALEDAAGGNFPIDGQAFVAKSETALDKALKSGSVPADIQRAMDQFKAGRQMTFQDFETLRSDLADVMRSASDGRQRQAANIIRKQLEELPLSPEAAALKPLADTARQAAAERFSKIEEDPAYKASVNDSAGIGEPSALADRFFKSYVTGPSAARANVARMQANLAADPLASQTISAGVLDHLKSQLKADPQTGNFSQSGYNGALKALEPKLDMVLVPPVAQQVRAVGQTAKLAQTQPRGSYVNNSNTATSLMAEGAKSMATHGTNMLFGGLPVGSVTRAAASRVIDARKAAKASEDALAPGAGITKLSDLPDLGKK